MVGVERIGWAYLKVQLYVTESKKSKKMKIWMLTFYFRLSFITLSNKKGRRQLHALIPWWANASTNFQGWVCSRVESGLVVSGGQAHCLRYSGTGCILNIVFFLKMLWFFLTLPVLLQRWCSTCHLAVHTLTLRINRESPEFGIFFKS